MEGAIPTQDQMKSRSTQSKVLAYLTEHGSLYLMLIPGIILLLIFHYYPMYGVIIAFQKFNPGLGFERSPWVGLDNFKYLFAIPGISQIFMNTLIIAVLKIITLQLSSLGLAILLNEVRHMVFKRAIQITIYLPHFLSWVVLSGILIDMLGSRGLMSNILRILGIAPIMFLGSNETFVPLLVITNLWKEVGWSTIIFLAALTGIDPTLHEAAAIDGASRWQRIVNVNIPGIAPTIILISCLSLGGILNAGFEQILNLYSPVVYQTGDILDTYVYRAGLISARYSLAGAIGLIKSVMGFILVVIAYWLADKYSGYRIY
jgi:putative aldouronate transport system permease protein